MGGPSLSIDPENVRGLTDDEIERELKRHEYIVLHTAKKLHLSQLPSDLYDDCIAAGHHGLFKAIRRFDPTMDVKFSTYAIALVRGAILEELRINSYFPRSVWDFRKSVEMVSAQISCQQNGSPATIVQIAQRLEMDEGMLASKLAVSESVFLSLDEPINRDNGNATIEDSISSFDESVEDRIERKFRLQELLRYFNDLPERERHVLYLYYYEELIFKKIGMRLGISESRAFQLHTQGIKRIRRMFDHDSSEPSNPKGEAEMGVLKNPLVADPDCPIDSVKELVNAICDTDCNITYASANAMLCAAFNEKKISDLNRGRVHKAIRILLREKRCPDHIIEKWIKKFDGYTGRPPVEPAPQGATSTSAVNGKSVHGNGSGNSTHPVQAVQPRVAPSPPITEDEIDEVMVVLKEKAADIFRPILSAANDKGVAFSRTTRLQMAAEVISHVVKNGW